MEESSFGATNDSGEFLDCNIRSPPKHRTSNAAGPSASKYKGVVNQPNGHWGAQIYANHQRIWLGTFRSETEAAKAYDSAAIKLRSGYAHRNFPWTDVTVREPSFQDQFSTEVVLSMIKDGSYASKFTDYLRAQDRDSLRVAALQDTPDSKMRELFQKELTPSDVGKLNRLVIPKKYASKFFPNISELNTSGTVSDIELVFYERSMRSWHFRYCFWKSSQSYVFTRGWNRFAKEKKLKARDRVVFSTYEHNGQKLSIIDVLKDGRVRQPDDSVDGPALQMKAEEPAGEMESKNVEGIEEVESGEEIMNENAASPSSKGFRLFGVKIGS